MQEPSEPKIARLIGTVPAKLGQTVFQIGREPFWCRAFPEDGVHTISILKRRVDLH